MSEPTELLPKSLVLEILDCYIDHIASPNECGLLREIRAEVLRICENRWEAFSDEELESFAGLRTDQECPDANHHLVLEAEDELASRKKGEK
jgi:hypothetical protein